jgi:RNA polymerase sigma factor (sigma-70 family)
VRAARDGDLAAWERIVRAQVPLLAAYLGGRIRRHEVVEKLVSEAIAVAWRRLRTYSLGDDFRAWMRRVAGQCARAWAQRHAGEPLQGPFPAERCADPAEAAAMRALDDAIGQLGEPQRMALEQHYRAGLDGDELGKVLHCDAAAARQLLEQAHQRLASFGL